MNDEQEQATDSAPIEDWVVCPKCLKEVPMHRAHYCVRVTITTPEYEVTPERLVELLHDARSKTKEANRRDFESSAELAALAKECEELRKERERIGHRADRLFERASIVVHNLGALKTHYLQHVRLDNVRPEELASQIGYERDQLEAVLNESPEHIVPPPVPKEKTLAALDKK